MKKIFLCLALVTYSITGFSQDADAEASSGNYNEIKLNGLYLVIGAFDITYERTLSEESALGVSVFLPFDEDIRDDLKYYVSPYYRLYFGKNYAAGFFIEGFGMLNSYNEYYVDYNESLDIYTEGDDFKTDFALGIGLGGKWVTDSGFVGELNLGIGRNLFNNDSDGDEIVGKVGITLGYRF
ncbi:MAG: DUF3575 domain-containing protein [Winogradskyella sp.]|nr:DUF3575 domain-containing protein [Winogradskyella sp.]NNL82487.1 DUF3575 domain-containing protein [Winogradskyella sp.]